MKPTTSGFWALAAPASPSAAAPAAPAAPPKRPRRPIVNLSLTASPCVARPVAADDEGATHVPLGSIGIIGASGEYGPRESLTKSGNAALSAHFDAYPLLGYCM